MKLMKSFSILLVLALVVTVGGVYANWVYNAKSSVLSERAVKPEMTSIFLQGGHKGSILDAESTVIIRVDDKTSGTTNEHLTSLAITGAYVFLYQPIPENASGTTLYWMAKENSATPTSYENLQVFNTATTPTAIPTDGSRHYKITSEEQLADIGTLTGVTFPATVDWQKHYDAGQTQYVIMITAEDLVQAIEIAEFQLSTVESYYAFETAIEAASFKIGIATDEAYLEGTWAGSVSTAVN